MLPMAFTSQQIVGTPYKHNLARGICPACTPGMTFTSAAMPRLLICECHDSNSNSGNSKLANSRLQVLPPKFLSCNEHALVSLGLVRRLTNYDRYLGFDRTKMPRHALS